MVYLNIMKYIKIIVVGLFGLYSLFFITGSCLAPLMAHFRCYDFSAQLTAMYMYSCHQRPDRSFWLMGYPVALCCRCLGFYTGVFISSIGVLLGKFKLQAKFLVILILFVFIDLLLNFIFNINTSNFLRFITGILMGVLFIFVLNFIFDKKKKERG